MYIQSINLTNFRSHSKYHLDCRPGTNLIIGPNGCGKTSVLEAIYILTQGKSFRAADPEILQRGAPFYNINLKYDNGISVTATFDGAVKTFSAAGKKTRRITKDAKHPVVLFEPDDLNLITGSPTRHRDYFDRVFSELSEEYASTLSKYNKAREQRNKLLKSDFCPDSDLFSWNVLLARYGIDLCHYRTTFTARINETLNQVYRSISNNADTVRINYRSPVTNLTESEFLRELESSKLKDLALGYTTFGVSRDDYEFIFNHKKASGSASRGESRSIILALKFVEANIVEAICREKPIVLLDDVFSELDPVRRRCLVTNFKNNQVIITSVEHVSMEPKISS